MKRDIMNVHRRCMLFEKELFCGAYERWVFLMKKMKKRFFAALLAFVMCLAVAGTAFAANYNWSQATSPTMTIPLGRLEPGSNINTCGVRASGVAVSPEKGTFQVKFQYKNMFGIWVDVGGTFTVNQHSERKYDTVTNTYVNGQPFVITCSTTKKAEYRLVFSNPTRPQNTAILDVRGSTWGN